MALKDNKQTYLPNIFYHKNEKQKLNKQFQKKPIILSTFFTALGKNRANSNQLAVNFSLLLMCFTNTCLFFNTNPTYLCSLNKCRLLLCQYLPFQFQRKTW